MNSTPGNIDKKQIVDAGMALTLILLLLGYFLKESIFYFFSIAALVINMSFPIILKPFAIVWFGVTFYLGTIVSKIILSIVFIVLVLPVGIIRKVLGKDSLMLNGFKKSNISVFKQRDYLFTKKDLEKPY